MTTRGSNNNDEDVSEDRQTATTGETLVGDAEIEGAVAAGTRVDSDEPTPAEGLPIVSTVVSNDAEYWWFGYRNSNV